MGGEVTEYLLVDGYNIIFAWDKLKQLAEDSLDDARVALLNMLSNYQGVSRLEIIVVFDAHKVQGGVGSVENFDNIKVVYTKEAETADNYIERSAAVLTKRYSVRVATSDSLEQIIILGRGARRMSAPALLNEIDRVNASIRSKYIDNRPVKKNMLLDNLDGETAAMLENMRRQKGI